MNSVRSCDRASMLEGMEPVALQPRMSKEVNVVNAVRTSSGTFNLELSLIASSLSKRPNTHAIDNRSHKFAQTNRKRWEKAHASLKATENANIICDVHGRALPYVVSNKRGTKRKKVTLPHVNCPRTAVWSGQSRTSATSKSQSSRCPAHSATEAREGA